LINVLYFSYFSERTHVKERFYFLTFTRQEKVIRADDSRRMCWIKLM